MNATTHARVAAPPVPPEVMARHLNGFLKHKCEALRVQAQAVAQEHALLAAGRVHASHRASHARPASRTTGSASADDGAGPGDEDPAPAPPLALHQAAVINDVVELVAQALVAYLRRSQ